MRYIKGFKNRGFTLIEILITLALLTIVTALSFSLYSHFNNSFNIANRQSDLQWGARLAKAKIEAEVRYARPITIMNYTDLAGTTLNSHQKAIYIENGSMGTLKMIAGTGDAADLLGNSATGIQMSLTFTKIVDNRLRIKVNCQVANSNDTYSLSSDLFIPKNAADGLSAITAPETKAGNVILYTN